MIKYISNFIVVVVTSAILGWSHPESDPLIRLTLAVTCWILANQISEDIKRKKQK